MKKGFFFATIPVVLIVGALLYFSGGNKEPLRVRLTWLHQAQFAGLYCAEDQEYYKNTGVNVSINPGGIDYSSVKMVSAKTDDIGITSADQILLARSKGVSLVALAAMYQKSPVVLFSLKSKGILKPEDLRGKKIGIKYGDNTEVPIRALLQQIGLKKGDFEEVSVSYGVEPLIDGRADVLPGFALNEPLSLQEKGYEVNLIYLADYGINFYADVIFTREDVLVERRGDVTKFLNATLDGYRYAIEHPAEAVKATLRRIPEAKEPHEAEMLRVSTALWKPAADTTLGQMDMNTWARTEEALISFGLQKEKVDLQKMIELNMVKPK
jgi:NitT/TauT family transport system substrate-binding protein